MITPEDFLAEARVLIAASRNNELRRRTVVGRAYYAAFHKSLLTSLKRGYRYPRDAVPRGRHEHLIRWMSLASDPSLREAGSLLEEMKILRRHADYDLDSTVRYDDMDETLEKAQHVIEELLAEL